MDGSARGEWGVYIEGDHLWPLSYGWYSAGEEWGSQGGLSVATVIWMVVQVGSGGVKGTICCHIDGSGCREWGSQGGPSVATVVWMVVLLGSGGVKGDHLLSY